MMRYLVCFLIAIILIACTFPPQRQPEPVTQIVLEPPVYETAVTLPAIEIRAKPIKPKPIIHVPALGVPPNPCLGIEAPELKEEVREKLNCLDETLK